MANNKHRRQAGIRRPLAVAAPPGPPPPPTPLMADLMAALTQRADDGQPGDGERTRQQVILHALIAKAAEGDPRCAQILIALKREGDAGRDDAASPGEPTAEDRDIVENFKAQVLGSRAPERAVP